MRYTIISDKPVLLKSDCGTSTIDGAGQSIVLSTQVDQILDTILPTIQEHLVSKSKKIDTLRIILRKTRDENTNLKDVLSGYHACDDELSKLRQTIQTLRAKLYEVARDPETHAMHITSKAIMEVLEATK